VMFGGSATAEGSTWELVGGDWRPGGGGGPQPRRRAAMTYDPIRHQVVLHGGTDRPVGMPGAPFADTWRYDGAWTPGPALVNAAPSARNYAGFAFEPIRRQFVLAGGWNPPGVSRGDTSIYDGQQWARDVDVPTLDVCRGMVCSSRMVFDEARGQLVLVRADGPTLQTWRFDGRRWLRLETPSAPPARQWFALAYDRQRQRVVLFGGGLVMGGDLDDTWELQGQTWIQAQPASRPPARAEAAMAYDEGRGTVVLFGGRRANQPLDDTWAFDGTSWVAVGGPRPPARQGAAMAYHRARGAMMLFGGDQPPEVFVDVWELTAAGWREQVIFEGPGPRHSPNMAYDPERDVLVLHGGDPRIDTWELRFRSVGALEVCAAVGDEDDDGVTGCADPDCADATCAPGRICRASACACALSQELRCGDGVDDDCDGALDCADSDCASGALCGREPACGDGNDEDGDGLRDCADPGCVGVGGCAAYEVRCGDGVDDDGDGRRDCADPDCFLRGCTEVP
jgi:hypothetical protein